LRATHARTLLPAALASVSFGFVLVRVRVRQSRRTSTRQSDMEGGRRSAPVGYFPTSGFACSHRTHWRTQQHWASCGAYCSSNPLEGRSDLVNNSAGCHCLCMWEGEVRGVDVYLASFMLEPLAGFAQKMNCSCAKEGRYIHPSQYRLRGLTARAISLAFRRGTGS